MKIGFFVNTFPCRSQTFVWSQIKGLLDQEQEVHVFARDSEEGQFSYHPSLYLHYEKVIEGRVLKQWTGVFSQLIKWLVTSPRLFLKLLPIFWQLRGCNVPRFLANLGWYRETPLNGLDVVVAHFGPNGLRANALKSLGLFDARIFVFFHGYDISEKVDRFGKKYYSSLFRSDATLLPISEFWKCKLIDLKASEKSVIVHRMGIAVDGLPVKGKGGSGEFVISSVARLVEKKGLEYAIKALEILKKEGRLFKYRIIGDGPLRKNLENMIHEFDLANEVVLVGPLSHARVCEEIVHSDVFVLPSVTSLKGDMEGIPVSLMESMAIGTPVISTYHSGIPELIENGVSGLLVPERDVGGLALAINAIMDDSKMAKNLSANARLKVVSHFELELLNKRLLGILSGGGYV